MAHTIRKTIQVDYNQTKTLRSSKYY